MAYGENSRRAVLDFLVLPVRTGEKPSARFDSTAQIQLGCNMRYAKFSARFILVLNCWAGTPAS